VKILTVLALALFAVAARAEPAIVAAENFYGDIAARIAGPGAKVTSILSDPAQDPHLFEAAPSTARALAGANLVIMNGVDYDAWMTKLLAASKAPGRKVIVVADLLKRRAPDNPHLWYDPATMPVVAAAVAKELIEIDPANRAGYETRLRAVLAALDTVQARVTALKAKTKGIPVTATEPIFGYMADALGLEMRNRRFQFALMNETEPSVRDVGSFQDDLSGRLVKAVIHNAHKGEPLAARMVKLAGDLRIPLVAVSELQPAGATYEGWMIAQLDALEKALAAKP
jgi:zinc/manganese transport system substrate-binding protein